MSANDEQKIDLNKLHTTTLGIERIKRNLNLEDIDVVEWVKRKIRSKNILISRKGKNWYVDCTECIITINAQSYTIITAHRNSEK